VKRVTVMFDGVSTNGTSNIQIQIGDSGGIETSGYNGGAFFSQTSNVGNAAFSTGFLLDGNTAASETRSGCVILSLFSSNKWTITGSFNAYNLPRFNALAGVKELSATLDRVRITTVNGTDTFDAGSINILYEG
jgi:hypothetical protein